MRLTLRTLLAWLDDMLPPDEVREIGRQVDESPLAREIVERIQRVTRQRRLTVPSATGPDATDANTVADYLDNVMNPDQVVEYEKKCLTSDVHLAEVASVHQILSLLGQKAKVPPAARLRMYQLVKGVENQPARTVGVAEEEHAPVAAALPEWHRPPAPPANNWRQWVRPLAALAGLLVLLAWSTYLNLAPVARQSEADDETEISATIPIKPAPDLPRVPDAAVAAVDQAGPERTKLAPQSTPEEPPAQPESPAPEAESDTEGEAVARPAMRDARDLAREASRLVLDASAGVVLRRPLSEGTWERVLPGQAVDPSCRLANLAPFWSPLDLGALSLVLKGSTVLEIGESAGGGQLPLALQQGYLVANSEADDTSLLLVLGQRPVRLTLPARVPIGLARERVWQPGVKQHVEPPLVVFVPEGKVMIEAGGRTEEVRGPARAEVAADGRLLGVRESEPPGWVTGPQPVVEAELGRQFSRFFREGDGAQGVANLVEAASSDQPEIRDLALNGLAQIERLSVVVGSLCSPGQPEARRAAIPALRSVLVRGPEAIAELRASLAREVDSNAWVTQIEQLLVGLTDADVADPQARESLVSLLESPDIALRELALENLVRLTRRGDTLGYDPDKPEAEKVKAWRDLFVGGR